MAYIYIANSTGKTFDPGTEAELVSDFRPKVDGGVFRGKCDGRTEEEFATFSEFDVHEELDFDDIEVDFSEFQNPLAEPSGEKYMTWLDGQLKNVADWTKGEIK